MRTYSGLHPKPLTVPTPSDAPPTCNDSLQVEPSGDSGELSCQGSLDDSRYRGGPVSGVEPTRDGAAMLFECAPDARNRILT